MKKTALLFTFFIFSISAVFAQETEPEKNKNVTRDTFLNESERLSMKDEFEPSN